MRPKTPVGSTVTLDYPERLFPNLFSTEQQDGLHHQRCQRLRTWAENGSSLLHWCHKWCPPMYPHQRTQLQGVSASKPEEKRLGWFPQMGLAQSKMRAFQTTGTGNHTKRAGELCILSVSFAKVASQSTIAFEDVTSADSCRNYGIASTPKPGIGTKNLYIARL
jgi:hypothetical protein